MDGSSALMLHVMVADLTQFPGLRDNHTDLFYGSAGGKFISGGSIRLIRYAAVTQLFQRTARVCSSPSFDTRAAKTHAGYLTAFLAFPSQRSEGVAFGLELARTCLLVMERKQ